MQTDNSLKPWLAPAAKSTQSPCLATIAFRITASLHQQQSSNGCNSYLRIGRASELIIGPFAVSGQCSAAELRGYIYMWGDVRGSNPQPPSSQPGALAA